MSYIQVYEGKSAFFSPSDDFDDVREALEKDADLHLVKETALTLNLKLGVTVNRDDDEIAVFLGADLYPNIHIYQSFTEVLEGRASPEQIQATHDLFEQVLLIIRKHGHEPAVRKGIVISNFM